MNAKTSLLLIAPGTLRSAFPDERYDVTLHAGEPPSRAYDVAIVDIDAPGALAAIETLHRIDPAAAVVLLGGRPEVAPLRDALRLGACALVPAAAGPDALRAAADEARERRRFALAPAARPGAAPPGDPAPDPLWICYEGGGAASVGASAAYLATIGKPLYVELPAVGTAVRAGEPLLRILGDDLAIHDVPAPLAGRVTHVNEALLTNVESLAWPGIWAVRVELFAPGRRAASAADLQAQQEGETVMDGKARVLVIDDEETVRQSFSRVLAEDGFSVATAGSGEAAAKSLSTEPFDMAFVDLKMPGMPGMEVVKMLRHVYPAVPVVVVTGYGSAESEAEARALGVHRFVGKPLSPEELTALAEGAWDLRRHLVQAHATTATAPPASETTSLTPAMPPLEVAAVTSTERPAEAPAAAAVAAADAPAPATVPTALEPALPAPTVGSVMRNAGALASGALVSVAYVLFLPLVSLGMIFWVLGETAVKAVRKIGRKAA